MATERIDRILGAVETYQGRLIRFAARITGDLESARDVVQDTFLRLCRQDLDEVADHLPAWLFRVCRNRALDVRKKEGPVQPLDETPARVETDSGGDPHDALERSDSTRQVLDALALLPAAQQEVLRLRFQEELSYKEISSVTGHSVSHVGVLIHVGLKTVRQRLGGRDDA